MHQPREVYQTTTLKILAHVKRFPGKYLMYKKHGHVRIFRYSDSGYAGDKRVITGHYTFVGRNLVTWRSKKQNVVSRSSAEAEFRAMAHTACEMMWLKNFMLELEFKQVGSISKFRDNQFAIYITRSPVFHEKTKHIEVDCHLFRDA